jgi:hypothetical protein
MASREARRMIGFSKTKWRHVYELLNPSLEILLRRVISSNEGSMVSKIFPSNDVRDADTLRKSRALFADEANKQEKIVEGQRARCKVWRQCRPPLASAAAISLPGL